MQPGGDAVFTIRIQDDSPGQDEPAVSRRVPGEEVLDDGGFDIVTGGGGSSLLDELMSRLRSLPGSASSTESEQEKRQAEERKAADEKDGGPGGGGGGKPKPPNDGIPSVPKLSRNDDMSIEFDIAQERKRALAREDIRDEVEARKKSRKGEKEEKGVVDELIDKIVNLSGIGMLGNAATSLLKVFPDVIAQGGPSIARGQYTDALLTPMMAGSDAIKNILSSVPLIGGMLGKFGGSIEDVISSVRRMTVAFLDRAKELEKYSGNLAQFMAISRLNQFRNDVYEANRLGTKYGILTNEQSRIDKSLTDIFVPIKRFLLDQLNPAMNVIANKLESMSDVGVVIETVLNEFNETVRKAVGGVLNPVAMADFIATIIPKVVAEIAREREARKNLQLPIDRFLRILGDTENQFVKQAPLVWEGMPQPQPPWGPGFPAHVAQGIQPAPNN